MDYSPPGSSVHGIFQARILKCINMPSSRGSSPSWDWICISFIGKWVLHHYHNLGSPWLTRPNSKTPTKRTTSPSQALKMPSLGRFHSLRRKIWPHRGDRLGEKFPTDANQLMELCHPAGPTLRTGLCELNRNSEHEFCKNVAHFSLLRERELWHRKCVCVCVWQGYVCLCVFMVRVCVCLMRVCVCVWWGSEEMRWKGATSSFS